MMSFLDCWTQIAATLFSQTLAGEPELVESFPRPFESGSFSFGATLEGEEQGRFSVTLDAAVLDSPLLGEGRDQRAGWGELLLEVLEAAAGELLTRTGKNCRVVKFEPADGESQASRAFELRAADRAWTILVRDEVRHAVLDEIRDSASNDTGGVPSEAPARSAKQAFANPPGMELLLDVELEATLRFGCREMPLGEILELGPGDSSNSTGTCPTPWT
jgi:flagellar motor switch/type III secretory pathway protein FliN